MGNAICVPDADRLTKRIDNELAKDDVEQRKKLKFLLLGSSDAGKSTIVKQMTIIHKPGGFTDTERINAIFQIRMNIVDAFKQICLFFLETKVKMEREEMELIKLFAHNSDKIEMMPEADELNLLNTLRYYSCIKDFFRVHTTHPRAPDNIFYFFPELHRILVLNYMPSNEDVLHMRIATLGVHETTFSYRKHIIRLIDVGGQRTERRKWIHFFEGVTAVMFVTSLASFDQLVEEDPKLVMYEALSHKPPNHILVRAASIGEDAKEKIINRLVDSVQLFGWVQKNNFLHSSTFLLFLNKNDLLTEKLKTLKFSDYIPEYEKWFTTDNSPTSVAEFIESMFRKEAIETEQRIYSHFTEAVNTAKVEYVFNSACDVIFQQAAKEVQLE